MSGSKLSMRNSLLDFTGSARPKSGLGKISYKGITLSGIVGIRGRPFTVGAATLLISQTISLSDDSKRNFDRRTDSTISAFRHVISEQTN
jgi:hypothetical protein